MTDQPADGRETADAWLDTCFKYEGERSSADPRRVFQGIGPETIGQRPVDTLTVFGPVAAEE